MNSTSGPVTINNIFFRCLWADHKFHSEVSNNNFSHAQHFASIISSYPYNNSMMYMALVPPFWAKGKLRLRKNSS